MWADVRRHVDARMTEEFLSEFRAPNSVLLPIVGIERASTHATDFKRIGRNLPLTSSNCAEATLLMSMENDLAVDWLFASVTRIVNVTAGCAMSGVPEMVTELVELLPMDRLRSRFPELTALVNGATPPLDWMV